MPSVKGLYERKARNVREGRFVSDYVNYSYKSYFYARKITPTLILFIEHLMSASARTHFFILRFIDGDVLKSGPIKSTSIFLCSKSPVNCCKMASFLNIYDQSG